MFFQIRKMMAVKGRTFLFVLGLHQASSDSLMRTIMFSVQFFKSLYSNASIPRKVTVDAQRTTYWWTLIVFISHSRAPDAQQCVLKMTHLLRLS